MEDLNDLYYFTEVARRGGFSAAARALKIPKSRLSRRIADLEERLGVRLLLRTTRQLHLTPIGEDFLVHCQAMVTEAQSAQELIEQGVAEPRGRIRVAAPVLLVQRRLGPMIPEFMQKHPRVNLELDATNRRVDVVAEGFDVAIRARTPPLENSDLVAKPLGVSNRYVIASPKLLGDDPARYPQTPEALLGWPSLSLTAPDGRYYWRMTGPDGSATVVEHQPILITDEMTVLLNAAAAGLGIVMLPELLCMEYLMRGEVIRLLDDWRAPYDLIHAIYVSRRRNIPAVQAFLDFLGERVAPRLLQLKATGEF